MSLKGLARNALASSLQVLVTSATLLLLYRFLVQTLGVEQVGIWSIVMASVGIARLADLGFGSGVTRFVATDLARHDPESAAMTIAMSALTMGGVAAAVSLVAYPFLMGGLGLIVPDEAVPAASSLLPYALGSFFLGAVATIFLCALDGCQRADIRALIVVCGSVGQLLSAYLLVPGSGLDGLGLAQVIQSGMLLLLAAGATLVSLKGGGRGWARWRKSRLIELVKYGGGTQVSAIGQFLFEPTVKMILTATGGLALTAYFDMANRLILQARSIIMSAYQTMVPFVAADAAKNADCPERLKSIYAAAYDPLFAFSFPYYCAIIAAAPFIIYYWLGEVNHSWVVIVSICALGWLANTLVGPAYFILMATGRLRWTIIAHISIGLLNLLIGGLLGFLFGGSAVVVGAMVALAVGSFLVVFGFHTGLKIPFAYLVPARWWLIIFPSVGVAVLATYLFQTNMLRPEGGHGPLAGIGALLGGLGLVVIWHPAFAKLIKRILRRH